MAPVGHDGISGAFGRSVLELGSFLSRFASFLAIYMYSNQNQQPWLS